MTIPIRIILSDKLYVRNPEQTDLGRKIVDFGIKLIDELGIEKFTFRKLANAIGSTEASIYRYFENKHKLLLYLVSWYWNWLEYLIDYQTNNIEDPARRLRIAIKVMANASTYDPNFSHIDEEALHRIVVAESSKAFLTKDVKGEDEEGLFQGFKGLSKRFADIIRAVNPDYTHPMALAITVVEAARNQIFFAAHFPGLTEIRLENGGSSQIAAFLEAMIFKVLDAGETGQANA